ncbi:hypothetical protein [Streptomyces paludis]|uniref:Uncharacterized protein n=1 Tax=Streptomyces paludis TaxID=2282738 RepID=A0A345HM38_9ACTN|nr:hypothetical protein [Streptomyces paludis]AXG77762.1 hypothetical protein DVK44_08700 [Streptomyces paludis]
MSLRRIVTSVIFSLLLTACGTEQQAKDRHPNMDMKQAGNRTEELLDATLNAVEPPVEWGYDTSNETACSTGLNLPTGTTSVHRNRYVSTRVSEQRRGNFFGVIQRYWEKQGFTITSVNADRVMPTLNARTPDGFALSLGVGAIGNVWFAGASPCASDSDLTFPKGTPDKPGGPKGLPDLVPRHESPFWSSTEPLKT